MYVWKQLSPSIPHELAFGVACGHTDMGPVRGTNEDNFLIDPAINLIAVADGMGGHESGEIASADALNWMSYYLRAKLHGTTRITNYRASMFDPSTAAAGTSWTEDRLRAMVLTHEAVEFSNQRMYQTNVDNHRGDGAGMGTTLTGMWQAEPGGPLYVFHVGDTRLYRWRNGALTQLTRDHTMYQHALETGMRSRLPGRNLLMQAIGPGAMVKPDFLADQPEPGDMYLLSSDGLHGSSTDEDINALLSASRDTPIDERCARLIDLALRDGSRDNMTVVLVECPR